MNLGYMKLEHLFGDEWFENNNLQTLNALDLKRKIRRNIWIRTMVKLVDKRQRETRIWFRNYHDWLSFRFNCKSKIVMHLEILFKNKEYDPQNSKAPGADDDGSGLAATLELARVFSKLKNKLTHTIQFCFFNAEEVGLRGSLEYAKFMRRDQCPNGSSSMYGYDWLQ